MISTQHKTTHILPSFYCFTNSIKPPTTTKPQQQQHLTICLSLFVSMSTARTITSNIGLEAEMTDDAQKQEQQQEEHFHVLAVDDSLIERRLLEKLLSFSSYKVTCVDSGDKALEYLGLVDDINSGSSSSSSSSSTSSHSSHREGSKVNLIMTDYCMPGMSGYDLLKRVKGSSWKDVPVVVMSSENVPSRIRMCLEEGAEEFLLKPLQLSDLNKLHPYLLRSLHNSCKDTDNSSEEDSSNHKISSKRKAVPPVKTHADKRPKLRN